MSTATTLQAAELLACIDDTCTDASSQLQATAQGKIVVDLPTVDGKFARKASAILTTADRRVFRADGPVQQQTPNGKDCGPVCAHASLTLA